MNEAKKYRLGNQPKEYELSTKYLGWTPNYFGSWDEFFHEHTFRAMPTSITLVKPDLTETAIFTVHQGVSKDAFPLAFFGEARAINWCNFLMVSEQEAPEHKFIIPMH